MQLADFDYDLPADLIAQHPPKERTAARLMSVTDTAITHGSISDLPELLQSGDLLILNDTRVVKARLSGRKATGGAAEIFLERVLTDEVSEQARSHLALCQVRVSKPMKPSSVIFVGEVPIICDGRDGAFYRLRFPIPVFDFLEQHGEVPLPPYIRRNPEASSLSRDGSVDTSNRNDSDDEDRYQTVFAQTPGAVAAPTAGLHFSEALIKHIEARGVTIARITLHVGAGTFQPVRSEALDEHVMHLERYAIPSETIAAITQTRANGGKVVAVGTTVVRALESSALTFADSSELDTLSHTEVQGELKGGPGETRLFIRPGFRFRVVDSMLTNFHLPKSTLLLLVSAFAGQARIADAYAAAVANKYRFFSYGDAMFIRCLQKTAAQKDTQENL